MINYISRTHEKFPDVLVIESGGRLDSDSSEFLLDCIDGFVERGHQKVVLDCGGLEYISSVGLGMLIRAKSRVKGKGGALAIAGAGGVAADALRLVSFDRLFGLYSDVDAAAEALQ